MDSSIDFDLQNPWYQRPNSGQVDAGSDVIWIGSFQVVLDHRIDASNHNKTPVHENIGLRVGLSGCKLVDQTDFLKKADKNLNTELHYRDFFVDWVNNTTP